MDLEGKMLLENAARMSLSHPTLGSIFKGILLFKEGVTTIRSRFPLGGWMKKTQLTNRHRRGNR